MSGWLSDPALTVLCSFAPFSEAAAPETPAKSLFSLDLLALEEDEEEPLRLELFLLLFDDGLTFFFL